MKKYLTFMLLIAAPCLAQSWTGIMSTARAIDWSGAGLPATFPDGETTPNPWTPPTRPACTSGQAGIAVPVAAGTSFATIITAMHSCSMANPTGSYLLLGSGAFTLSSTASLSTAPYVTLRGSGPMSTTLTMTANLTVGGNGSIGGGVLNASPSVGTTSVTVTGASGQTPVTGQLAWFNQCDSGFSGSTQNTSGYNSCGTGSITDNGYVFVCGGSTTCNSNGSGSGGGLQTAQKQQVIITSVVNGGGGSYTIGFTPGLYLTNWSTSNTAALYWSTGNSGFGSGLEDLTIIQDSGQVNLVGYASWIKGVRFIGNAIINVGGNTAGKNNLFMNNYLFGATPSSMSGNAIQVLPWNNGDSLFLNNISEQGVLIEGQGSTSGDVIAYNYSKGVTANYVQATNFQHDNNASGVSFILNEGNEFNSIIDDDTWGTGNLNTFFRNWISCSDEPYVYGSVTGTGIAIDAFHRFDNGVGNVIGGTSQCSTYSSSSNGSVWRVGARGSDTLTVSSLMLWYNHDFVTGTTRCQSSEVPTSLSGNATPFENSVPASCSAPASFYMGSMGFYPNGGTGLSWWKVCTNWTTFPTSCSSSTTEPFPSTGPDVTGGSLASGYSYPNPALLAWTVLPIDTTYQNSYTVTGSSWASGTETLTVSGLPGNLNDIFGPFQISGGNCATSGAGTSTGAEVQITGSSTTTIQYALASNPGNCTGTMLWPDVRQFDERVYQSDPANAVGSQIPSGNHFSGGNMIARTE